MTRFKKLKEKIEADKTRNDITAEEFNRYLNHYGFFLSRTRGSHHIYKNIYGKELTIPIHGNTVKSVYVKNSVLIIKEENNEK